MGFLANIVGTLAKGATKTIRNVAGQTYVQIGTPPDEKKSSMKNDTTTTTNAMPEKQWIAGVPNWAVIAGGGVLAYMLFLAKPKRRR